MGNYSIRRALFPLSKSRRKTGQQAPERPHEMELTGPHMLDTPAAYDRHDPTGMGTRLLSLPEQAKSGWIVGEKFSQAPAPVESVLIAGMGGSAIGGDMIKGLADLERGNAQITTWRDYGLPGWVDDQTLIVAISVSGETVETRSAFATAAERGARRIALTGPGPLLSEARRAEAEFAEIEWKAEPRAALGYTFVAPYRALQRLGALADASDDFEPAVQELEELAAAMAIEAPVDENIAKQIAIELGDRLPVILSARHLIPVAMRWKTQFNENTDAWAAWEAAPDVGHNMIQAALGGNASESSLYVLALKPATLSAAVSEAIDISLQLLSEHHVPNLVLDITAPNPLGEVLSGALMGDMVSYYSAILHARNPSATANLTAMKSRLDPMSAERS